MKIENFINRVRKHSTRNYGTRNISQVDRIGIHHSATTSGSAESFANYHVGTLGWPGIGYHFVIEKSGQIKQTNLLRTVSYHVGGQNTRSVGICMVGNFTVEEPTNAQRQSVKWLIDHLLNGDLSHLNMNNVIGHREFPRQSTSCPAILMGRFRRNAANFDADKDLYGSNPSTPTSSLLRFGSQGIAVTSLQEELIMLGYALPEWGPDGSFGAETEAAVTKFQADHNLTVDGIAGPQTFSKLKELIDNNGEDNTPEEPIVEETLYRVRKSWDLPGSQIGAYVELDNAKKATDDNKGYAAFDEDGNVVYSNQNVKPSTTRGKIIAKRAANIRSGKSTSTAILGTVNRGAYVDVISDEGSWAEIWYENEKAYVSRSLLEMPNESIRQSSSLTQRGDRGDHVIKWQQKLMRAGYSIGSAGADGIFGPSTETQTRSFQSDTNITTDGVVGPQTERTMSNLLSMPSLPTGVLRQGDRGESVRRLQLNLNSRGFDVGSADGIFGPATNRGVRNAQQQHRITVDGVYGPQTRQALS